jgi:transposase InsO family protein
MWVELLAMKIKAAAELESGRRLKAFRTDCGGEFNSGIFVSFCNDHGIKHNTTMPYTPQQNGVVERPNQTVVEMARCLLKTMQVYLLNRAPTKSLNGKTPFEAWFGRKPGVKHLRTFGCTAYAKCLGPGLNKLADRAVPGVFFGYAPGTKGYRVYDPVKDRLIISRDVLFDEKRAWNWGGEWRWARQ